MNAIFWPQPEDQPKAESYAQFDSMMNQCDIVLVEGDSRSEAAKIEVYRVENEAQPMATTEQTIQALVTDDDVDTDTPPWKRSDLNSIVRNIESLLQLAHT